MASTFTQLIENLLEKGRLSPKDISWVLTNHIATYEKAFTSPGYNSTNNYEELEQKGDASANAFLVWYFYNRFPQLDCSLGVPVIARLKIVYSSKTTFFGIARKLGFWKWIKATQEERDTKEKSLLEDVFESFIGATQDIFDKKYEMGFGFTIVCRILKVLFDDIHISLEYEDLYDAKSRLKEYFDGNKHLGKLLTDYNMATKVITLYTVEPQKPTIVNISELQSLLSSIGPNKDVNVTIKNNKATVSWDNSKNKKILATASGQTKPEAEQKASQLALTNLNVTTTKNISGICA